MHTNIGQHLTKRAFMNPNLEAVVDYASSRRFTFKELNERSNRIANALAELGIQKGDRVAILMYNRVEYLESFCGLAKLGAICVPLNWRLVPDELTYIMQDAGVSAVLYEQAFGEQIESLYAKEALAVQHWVEVAQGDHQPFAHSYETITDQASTAEPVCTSGDDDDLFIMYTSGTTGLPKGVVHTHETISWALITILATADTRFMDRYSIALPLFHVGALTPILGNIYIGITSVLLQQFDPGLMWEIIEEERITITLAVPAMLNFMLAVPELKTADRSTLRWIMSGAAPVPTTLIEQYAGLNVEIHQVYGLTECGGPACLISPTDALQHVGSTGKAFFHTEVRVITSDGRDVSPGEPGEVIVRGRHIMKAYWNNPEASAQTIRNGWLHTGDIALMDADGFITIHDRLKDMVISGGENVYPAEIENVLLGHPEVAEVAVIGQPSERWGESPFAIVVRKDEQLSVATLMGYCETKLARFKLPKGVAFVDSIPRNPTGKALKRLLREQFPGPASE